MRLLSVWIVPLKSHSATEWSGRQGPVQKPVRLAPQWAHLLEQAIHGGLYFQLFAMTGMFRDQQLAGRARRMAPVFQSPRCSSQRVIAKPRTAYAQKLYCTSNRKYLGASMATGSRWLNVRPLTSFSCT